MTLRRMCELDESAHVSWHSIHPSPVTSSSSYLSFLAKEVAS